MADHGDAPESSTDITDRYIFQEPGNPTMSIFVMNVNPDVPDQATMFDPHASYELKIDTNGDAEPDIAYHVLFASSDDGQQTATVYHAASAAAQDAGAVGAVLIQDAPVSFGR